MLLYKLEPFRMCSGGRPIGFFVARADHHANLLDPGLRISSMMMAMAVFWTPSRSTSDCSGMVR